MNDNRVCMLVVTHKPFEPCTSDSSYKTIAVGNNKDLFENVWRDDVGTDQIAELNYCFCELTALYWFWKNALFTSDICGLSHYRRYFASSIFSQYFHKPISEKKIRRIIKDDNIIVLPKPFYWNTTVKKMYYECGAGRKEDLDKLRLIIKDIAEDYLDAYDKILSLNHASYCNMMISSSVTMKKYCEWLFPILFSLQGKIDLSNYDEQEKRIFGYLSEILINVWVYKNQYKVKHLRMINTNFSKVRIFKGNMINLRNRILF